MTKASAERQSEEHPHVVFSDGLGDRHLAVDPDTGDPIERFQVNPDLAAQERALRERVDRLLNFRHVRYPILRGMEVQTVAQQKTIWLVSDHTPGLRLSSVLAFVAKHETLVFDVNAALQVAREVLPALAVLHDSRGVTHGAMGLERLVIMPHGRVVIVDYALGLALERLQFPRTRLWRDFHVAMPPSAGLSRFDARADVANVAVALLTLLLGRPLAASEFPKGIASLVDSAHESLPNGTVRPLSSSLKSWFERALPIEARRSFSTALEANLALEDVIKRERAYAPTSAALKSFLQRYDSCSGTATASEPVHGAGDRSAWKSSRSGPGKPGQGPTLRVARPHPLERRDDEDDEIRALEAELARIARLEKEAQASGAGPPAALSTSASAAEQPDALPALTLVPDTQEPVTVREPDAVVEHVTPVVDQGVIAAAATQAESFTAPEAVDAPAEVEILVMGERLPARDVATLDNGEAATMVVGSPTERPGEGPPFAADIAAYTAADSDDEIRALELLLQQVQAEEARQPIATPPPAPDAVPGWTLTPPDDVALVDVETGASDETLVQDTWTIPLDFETVPIPDYVLTLVAAGHVNDALAAEPGAITAADIARLQVFAAGAAHEPGAAVLPFAKSRASSLGAVIGSVPGLAERTSDAAEGLSTRPQSVLSVLTTRAVEDVHLATPLRLVAPGPRQRKRRTPPAIAAEATPIEARLQTVPQAAVQEVAEAPVSHVVVVTPDPALEATPEQVVEGAAAAAAAPALTVSEVVSEDELPDVVCFEAPPLILEAPAGDVSQGEQDAPLPVVSAEEELQRLLSILGSAEPAIETTRSDRDSARFEDVTPAAESRQEATLVAPDATPHVPVGAAAASAIEALEPSEPLHPEVARKTGRKRNTRRSRRVPTPAPEAELPTDGEVIAVPTIVPFLPAPMPAAPAPAIAAAAACPVPEDPAPSRLTLVTPTAGAAIARDHEHAARTDEAGTLEPLPGQIPDERPVMHVVSRTDPGTPDRDAPESAPALVYEPWRVPAPTTPSVADRPARPVAALPADPWNVEAEAAKAAQVVPFTAKPIDSVTAEPPLPGAAAPVTSVVAAEVTQPRPAAADVSTRVLDFDAAKASRDVADSSTAAVGAVQAPSRRGWRINWKRTAAASLAVILLEGVAFAMAYWLVKPGQDGSLLVQTSPPGVEVLIDGRKSGSTPVAVKLRPGRHTLEMRGFGTTKVVPVEISAGVQTTQTVNWARTARTGKMKITTTPAGARVLVDGSHRGTSPLTVDDISVGQHQVVAQSAAGTVRSSVTVEPNEIAEVDLGIFSGWLSVFAPIEVRIFDGGKLLGTSLDGKLLISPGTHTIELVNTRLGYREKRTVDIEPGRHTPLSVEAPKGSIIVEAPDLTEVIVDGQKAGTMPIPGVSVPIGTREVVLRHPSIAERRLTVTVTADGPARVSLVPPQ